LYPVLCNADNTSLGETDRYEIVHFQAKRFWELRNDMKLQTAILAKETVLHLAE
jgi:hypothetical protein